MKTILVATLAIALVGCSNKPPDDREELRTAYARTDELTAKVAELELAAGEVAKLNTEQAEQIVQLTAQIATLNNAPPTNCAAEIDALKAKAKSYIDEQRATIAQRDATISRLQANMATVQPAPPQKAAVAQPNRTSGLSESPNKTSSFSGSPAKTGGFSGPQKFGSGGVHVNGKTCSIPGHNCGLPRP